ncbi:MAG: zinc carboxypeptidase [Clostridiales bacterium]|nr:zinc carboxypeptidase [Clostridiales bacterium]
MNSQRALETLSYEKIYLSLWETASRYQAFARFRVIGKSHDDRLIPMLELGNGTEALICLAGVRGSDSSMPEALAHLSVEYAAACEKNRTLGEFYPVRELLDRVRICVLPVLNPDGYEICRRGYLSVRNSVFRQMLRMQGTPEKEFAGNARGIDLTRNFPTKYCRKDRIHHQPASENETRALIHIFQEYPCRGLLSFCTAQAPALYCQKPDSLSERARSRRVAGNLRKYTIPVSGKNRLPLLNLSGEGCGSPEQYFAETIKKPAFRLALPMSSGKPPESRLYRDMRLLPLEYIYTLIPVK